MSAYDAEPTGEVKNDSDEPIQGHNGVDYGSYASEGNIEKATNVDMNFDSKDYERRQHNSLLVNVEGADRIKREEERRKLEADRARIDEINRLSAEKSNNANGVSASNNGEKALRRAIKQKQRADRLQEKKAKSASALRRLLHNKKFYVVLTLILIAGVAAMIVIINIILPEMQKTAYTNNAREYAAGTQNASTIDAEARRIFNESTFDEANNYYSKQLSESSGQQKILIAIYYASFVIDYAEDYESALGILDSVSGIDMNEDTKNSYYNAYMYLYTTKGDEEGAKECAKRFGRELE